MRLLKIADIPAYEADHYTQQAKQFNLTKPMGEYFVFSDKGDFLGYTDGISQVVHTLQEDIPLKNATQVEFKAYSFHELSMRHKVSILHRLLEIGYMKMERLESLNPTVLFTLDNILSCLSYHDDKTHMIDLTTLEKVPAVSSRIVLPCRYHRTMNDVRADMSIWMERNQKQVELNCKDVMLKGIGLIKSKPCSGMEVLLHGHLLGIEIIKGICKTELFKEEKYVTEGWSGIPVMTISANDVAACENGLGEGRAVQKWCQALMDFFDTYEGT